MKFMKFMKFTMYVTRVYKHKADFVWWSDLNPKSQVSTTELSHSCKDQCAWTSWLGGSLPCSDLRIPSWCSTISTSTNSAKGKEIKWTRHTGFSLSLPRSLSFHSKPLGKNWSCGSNLTVKEARNSGGVHAYFVSTNYLCHIPTFFSSPSTKSTSSVKTCRTPPILFQGDQIAFSFIIIIQCFHRHLDSQYQGPSTLNLSVIKFWNDWIGLWGRDLLFLPTQHLFLSFPLENIPPLPSVSQWHLEGLIHLPTPGEHSGQSVSISYSLDTVLSARMSQWLRLVWWD